MKSFRREQSPKFKKRYSFESPQCSTVVQVNPSCESEESMLQKIIFPDHMASENHFQNDRHPKEPLRQRSMNIINVNREIGKLNKNIKYLDENADPKCTKAEYPQYQLKDNQENFSKRFQSYRSSKQKYEPEPQTDKYSRQRMNSLSSAHSLSNLMQRTTSKLGSRLQSYQSSEFKKHYSTQKYKNQYSYNNNDQHDSQTVIDEVKLRQIQQKIMRYRQKNRKPGTSGSKELHRQPMKTTSFRDTMEMQLNNIQIDFLPERQNRLKKKQTIIDNISLLDKDYVKSYPIPSQKSATQTISRVPGRLMTQNKGLSRKESEFFQPKRFEHSQKEPLKPSDTFRVYNEITNTLQIPTMQDLPIEKLSERRKRITKNVYMQPTQKTQTDEVYQPRYRQRYETQIDMNEKALELMLEEERAKKYVPLNIKEKKQKQFSGEDDELERLNNLEKKFNQHFNSRK